MKGGRKEGQGRAEKGKKIEWRGRGEGKGRKEVIGHGVSE